MDTIHSYQTYNFVKRTFSLENLLENCCFLAENDTTASCPKVDKKVMVVYSHLAPI